MGTVGRDGLRARPGCKTLGLCFTGTKSTTPLLSEIPGRGHVEEGSHAWNTKVEFLGQVGLLEAEQRYAARHEDRAGEPCGADLFLEDEGGEGSGDDDAGLPHCGH